MRAATELEREEINVKQVERILDGENAVFIILPAKENDCADTFYGHSERRLRVGIVNRREVFEDFGVFQTIKTKRTIRRSVGVFLEFVLSANRHYCFFKKDDVFIILGSRKCREHLLMFESHIVEEVQHPDPALVANLRHNPRELIGGQLATDPLEPLNDLRVDRSW